jgi:hypothetical protein
MSVEDLYTKVQILQMHWAEELKAMTPQTAQKVQAERNDSFRTALEPDIYALLNTRYMEKLNANWRTYMPPKKSEYAFAVVERRAHPNFDWVLKNMAWAGPNMAVYLFCSDENEGFIRGLLGDKADAFNIRVVFKGNPSRERGKKEVDNLLSDWRTYASIDAKYILTVEMDCFLRKQVPRQIFQGDYWGCTWGWQPERPGGGGLTVRKISSMIELCRKHRPNLEVDLCGSQDCWLSDKTQEDELDFPRLDMRTSYLMENMLQGSPVGVHQFWTYFFNTRLDNKEAWCGFVSHILTLEGL